MSAPVIQQLILKDLYLNRRLILLSLVGGALLLAVTPVNRVLFYVGTVGLLCLLIVLLIFVVINGVSLEKRDKVQLFVLSLPVSPMQYAFAKAAANFLAFFLPWLILTVGAVLVLHLTRLPDGFIPIAVTVLTFLFMYYCVLLAVSLVSDSQGWQTVVIIAGNISINFVIAGLLSLPSAAHAKGAEIVWTGDLLLFVTLEITLGVLAIVLAFRLYARKQDYI